LNTRRKTGGKFHPSEKFFAEKEKGFFSAFRKKLSRKISIDRKRSVTPEKCGSKPTVFISKPPLENRFCGSSRRRRILIPGGEIRFRGQGEPLTNLHENPLFAVQGFVSFVRADVFLARVTRRNRRHKAVAGFRERAGRRNGFAEHRYELTAKRAVETAVKSKKLIKRLNELTIKKRFCID
jgi:hypothetical protein